jgi:hypothetical protein
MSICTKVEPMSKGPDNVPLLMASLFDAKSLVEFRVSFASDFDPVTSCFGDESFITTLGVHVLRLIKNLTPF